MSINVTTELKGQFCEINNVLRNGYRNIRAVKVEKK